MLHKLQNLLLLLVIVLSKVNRSVPLCDNGDREGSEQWSQRDQAESLADVSKGDLSDENNTPAMSRTKLPGSQDLSCYHLKWKTEAYRVTDKFCLSMCKQSILGSLK